ncbi:MAG TPA: nickel pincer cofactor biosynthesis protein LarB [Atribacteraceae bacterium]|nr:nickel pincer cofactor biosynthesis protein LarB [Atribacteraceae bacterium]
MREILEKLQKGLISLEEAQTGLEKAAFDTLKLKLVDKLARLDLNRAARTGLPEVILALGKKDEWVEKLLFDMALEQGRAIASKVHPALAEKLAQKVPRGFAAEVHVDARLVIVRKHDFIPAESGGRIGVLAAGTADLSIAEEARVFARELGCTVFTAYDVGIAGLQRTLEALEVLLQADVDILIVVAGMDAVLPITVRGLVDLPVIGVPSAVGYGIGDRGLAPLLTMLQSCSPGLAVVNIDNGFGAAAFAALVANRIARYRSG